MNVEELDKILSEELRLYDELAQACGKATDKILYGDMDGLADVTRWQNELIIAAAQTEKARTALLRELTESGTEQSAETSSKSNLQFIPEPCASRFAEHTEKLRLVVEELRQSSENNRSLLAYSLELVDRAVRLVCDTLGTDGTYQLRASSTERPHSAAGLLNKEA